MGKLRTIGAFDLTDTMMVTLCLFAEQEGDKSTLYARIVEYDEHDEEKFPAEWFELGMITDEEKSESLEKYFIEVISK